MMSEKENINFVVIVNRYVTVKIRLTFLNSILKNCTVYPIIRMIIETFRTEVTRQHSNAISIINYISY